MQEMFKFVLHGRIVKETEELVKLDGSPTGNLVFTVAFMQGSAQYAKEVTTEVQADKYCREEATSLKLGQQVAITGQVKVAEGTSQKTGKPYNIKNFKAETIVLVANAPQHQQQQYGQQQQAQYGRQAQQPAPQPEQPQPQAYKPTLANSPDISW